VTVDVPKKLTKRQEELPARTGRGSTRENVRPVAEGRASSPKVKDLFD